LNVTRVDTSGHEGTGEDIFLMKKCLTDLWKFRVAIEVPKVIPRNSFCLAVRSLARNLRVARSGGVKCAEQSIPSIFDNRVVSLRALVMQKMEPPLLPKPAELLKPDSAYVILAMQKHVPPDRKR